MVMVKWSWFTLTSLLSKLTLVSSCDGDHHGRHRKREQREASPPVGWPHSPLVWGDLNIIHTTDTHGWLIGHLKSEEPEPNYSGDFGDFQSFVAQMKYQADEKNVDLLIIDTGDIHDGNGLSDAEPLVRPGVPRGTTSNKFLAKVPYDLLAIGNHELYDLSIAQDMHDNFAPVWKGSYLTSNVNITTSGVSVPIGSRYRKFKTQRGRKITAFGILFNFTGNAIGTVVQPPTQLITEPWFKEAIQDPPDVFLLTGHMGITDSDWNIVFQVIRDLHPKIPVIILGGHLHIRDCKQLDNRSMSLASGRYMETIGWMSLSGLDDLNQTPKFSRRYLDPNRNTYCYHAQVDFDTPQGLNTTKEISETAKAFNITYRFGVAPQSFFSFRVPSDSQNSLNQLFVGQEGVLRTVVSNTSRPHLPHIVINTGSMRFDVYKGDFTVNDELITMPFENTFVYVPDVPRKTAEKFLDAMNSGGIALNRRLEKKIPGSGAINKDEKYHLGDDVEEHYMKWLESQANSHQASNITPTQLHLVDKANADPESVNPNKHETYGYVTEDECPGMGDDTLHTPLPVYPQPNYVGTALPVNAEHVDVVFFSFIKSFALSALNKADVSGSARKYTAADIETYMDVKSNQLLGIYAQKKWS